MHTDAILHEAQQLYSVSDRLDSLAAQHPLASEILITISRGVRNTTNLLEVLVATKMPRSPNQVQQIPDLLIALFEPSVVISVWN
jgi:hypothetical protein